jgi:hypothetical protein
MTAGRSRPIHGSAAGHALQPVSSGETTGWLVHQVGRTGSREITNPIALSLSSDSEERFRESEGDAEDLPELQVPLGVADTFWFRVELNCEIPTVGFSPLCFVSTALICFSKREKHPMAGCDSTIN